MTVRPPTIDRPTEIEAPESAEALFREARRRRRRRWVLGSAVVVVTGAIAIAFGVGTNGPARRPRPTSTPTTPAPSSTPTTNPKITAASALFDDARITYTTGMSFLDPTDGYAIFRTDEGTSPQTCGHLFVGKTTDGGGQFRSVTRLPGCQANAITFDDRDDGFVYGPDLYVTHDGGSSWTAEKEPGDVLSVRPYGNSIWMLVSQCPAGEPTTTALCHLAFFDSPNGGRSWTQEAFPTTALMYTQGGAADPQSVVRASRSTGYVVPAPLHENRAATKTTAGMVAMWSTTDGGKFWVEHEIPCGMLGSVTVGNMATSHAKAPLGAVVSAAPTGTLFAVCSYSYPGQTPWLQYWTVFTSADGGVTWSKRASKVFGGKLGKLDALSSTTAFELGFHGRLIKTSDGGSSWSPTGGPGIVTSPYALEFFGSIDGVALDSADLWHTADAGAAWTQVVPTVVATSAPACTSNQLRVRNGHGAQADGHVLHVVLLTNTGPTCTLSGTPLLVGTTPDGRRSLGVGAYTWFGTLDPALLSRGEQGQLWLQTTTTCGGATHGRVDHLVAGLPGRGGTLSLPELSFTLACGISETELGIPRSSTAPLGSAASLRVDLSGLPVTVISGSLLHYTVTLYNLTTVAVSMAPCPRYSVLFQTATGTSTQARVLARATGSITCHTLGSIPPGGVAHVTLSVRAPRVKHITTTSFTWKFDVPGVVTPPTSASSTGIARSGMKTLTARAAAQNGIK